MTPWHRLRKEYKAALGAIVALSVWPASAREHGAPRNVKTVTTIVVHTIGGPACLDGRIKFEQIPFRADDAAFWRDVLRSAPVADAHFVIGRTGKVARVLSPSEIANHTVGANAVSIGIELVHRGDGVEPFEPSEIASLIDTINQLRRDYPWIAFNNVVGHDTLDQRTCRCRDAPYRRRQDPGSNFPWDKVLAAIRLPTDPPRGKQSLTPLIGPAPAADCTKH